MEWSLRNGIERAPKGASTLIFRVLILYDIPYKTEIFCLWFIKTLLYQYHFLGSNFNLQKGGVRDR